MEPKKIVTLVVSSEDPSSLVHSARTAVAGVAALLVARLFRMHEAYWASITALIVMQSTLGASLSISAKRFLGTAVGAIVGALAAIYLGSSVAAFGVMVFLLGLLCAALGIDRAAYRYAGITLAVIMLIPRTDAPWAAAIHRFIEVSIGILVALAIAAIRPEKHTVTKTVSARTSVPTAAN